MSYYYNRLKGILYSKIKTSKSRQFAQSIAANLVPKKELLGNDFHFKLDEVNKHEKELNEKGITFLGKILDDEKIEDISKFIMKLKCHDTWSPDLGEFTLKEVTEDTHTASFKRSDLVRNKIIFEIANNASILEIVRGYLGATPTISNVNAWWSLGGRKKAQQAQNFHRDNDDIKFCKLFIYLTDVSVDSGPHIYIESTVNSPKCREIKRYSDEEVKNAFDESQIKTLVYPKGNAFIEDTYGIHKGLLPKLDNRLLLQIQYSISPIGYIKYQPEVLNNKIEYSKYINRLIAK